MTSKKINPVLIKNPHRHSNVKTAISRAVNYSTECDRLGIIPNERIEVSLDVKANQKQNVNKKIPFISGVDIKDYEDTIVSIPLLNENMHRKYKQRKELEKMSVLYTNKMPDLEEDEKDEEDEENEEDSSQDQSDISVEDYADSVPMIDGKPIDEDEDMSTIDFSQYNKYVNHQGIKDSDEELVEEDEDSDEEVYDDHKFMVMLNDKKIYSADSIDDVEKFIEFLIFESDYKDIDASDIKVYELLSLKVGVLITPRG